MHHSLFLIRNQRTLKNKTGFFLLTLFLFSFSGNISAGDNFPESPYKSIDIGNNVWMTKNLDLVVFRNGDTIPEVRSPEAWQEAAAKQQPAWRYYHNLPENGEKYFYR